MERKDMDIPADVEELFPEEILLSHYVEAWKFIVGFKQERGQRQWEQDLSFIPFFILYVMKIPQIKFTSWNDSIHLSCNYTYTEKTCLWQSTSFIE